MVKNFGSKFGEKKIRKQGQKLSPSPRLLPMIPPRGFKKSKILRFGGYSWVFFEGEFVFFNMDKIFLPPKGATTLSINGANNFGSCIHIIFLSFPGGERLESRFQKKKQTPALFF